MRLCYHASENFPRKTHINAEPKRGTTLYLSAVLRLVPARNLQKSTEGRNARSKPRELKASILRTPIKVGNSEQRRTWIARTRRGDRIEEGSKRQYEPPRCLGGAGRSRRWLIPRGFGGRVHGTLVGVGAPVRAAANFLSELDSAWAGGGGGIEWFLVAGTEEGGWGSSLPLPTLPATHAAAAIQGRGWQ